MTMIEQYNLQAETIKKYWASQDAYYDLVAKIQREASEAATLADRSAHADNLK